MISDEGLVALRIAATLTHGLPRVRCRVRGGGQTLVEVRALDDGDEPVAAPARLMTPCAFRCAVARAHRLHQAGDAMEMAGLASSGDPSVEIGTPPGGVARPGGIYRVPVGDQHCWAFAITLDPEDAFPLGQQLVDARPLPDVVAMGLRRDRATDITLAFARTRAQPGSPSEARLVDLFESLLARWTIHELLAADIEPGHDDRAV